MKRLIVSSIAIIAVTLAAGCDDKKSKKEIGTDLHGEVDGTVSKTSNILAKSKSKDDGSENQSIYELANVGVKNFDQINVTMSRLTGVPVSETKNLFNNVKSSLPSKNNFALFSGSMQVSVVKLASEYCQAAYGVKARRDAILGSLSPLFDGNLQTAFSAENRKLIMAQFAKTFWVHQSNYANEAATEKTIKELFDELMVDRTNNQAEARRLLRATCVLYLSAAPVVIL
ncbi:hypothetical protein N9D31_02845 [Oligoflexaceae bacterium]|nr:hypothetical protein [Oligoflexaceae bacterium]